MNSNETVYGPHDDLFDGSEPLSLYEGVISRRAFAFIVDAGIIFALMIALYFVFFIVGLMTFGLLLPLMALAFPIAGIGYTAMTLGGPKSATVGMRMVDLEMRQLSGAKIYPLLGAAHALAFYFTAGFLTPLILLLALFNRRSRTLHDYLCGTVVVNRLDQLPSY